MTLIHQSEIVVYKCHVGPSWESKINIKVVHIVMTGQVAPVKKLQIPGGGQ